MNDPLPYSYPLTMDELEDALARGRRARSEALLAWLFRRSSRRAATLDHRSVGNAQAAC